VTTGPWALWQRQVRAIVRLELKKHFLSRRAWWIWVLAFAPVILCLTHSLADTRGHELGVDTQVFAGIYQFFYLRLGIYFGCVGIFMNLFRGDVLEKTLHYYLLAPVRREVLLAGKYATGVAASILFFGSSTALSFFFCRLHFGDEFQDFVWRGPGLEHLLWYLMTTALGCLGYGAVFLLMGLVARNPMIPAALVLVWEGINNFLPAFLQKVSITFYLKSLVPVTVPMEGPVAIIAVAADPAPAWLAIGGLVVVSSAILWAAMRRVRDFEISYVE